MKRKNRAVHVLAVLSLVWLALFKAFSGVILKREPAPYQAEMLRAAESMDKAIRAVRQCRADQGTAADPVSDPIGTGLIGVEWSDLTTSLGDLEAKRTTTNPEFAALLVHWLKESGVKKGDAVAVNASGSFPALIIAAAAAVDAVEARPLWTVSLGASQWGANDPEFDLLDILGCLLRAGLMKEKPLAVSLGGEGDTGADMDPRRREALIRKTRERGIPYLEEQDLERNVRRRIELYESSAGGGSIRVFINIGGNRTSLGEDSEILRVEPGLTSIRRIPPAARRGLIFEMAARRVPVIHLLNIRGICLRTGLPWDPVPLPEPGKKGFPFAERSSAGRFLLFLFAYLSLACVIGITADRKRR